MGQPQSRVELKGTPRHASHVRLGARMGPFPGYEMPVQYSSGIVKEHLHTRAAAGLFDVSHMGQIALRPRSGRIVDAVRALEALLPGDILGLAAGGERYTTLTNGAGGIDYEPMGWKNGGHFVRVVKAGRADVPANDLRSALCHSPHAQP